jgi:hypothetical protein
MSLITASNTIQTNKFLLSSSYGTAGQVLVSGGSGGNANWTTLINTSSIQTGSISAPTFSATPTFYTFPIAFSSIPNVVLTVDNNNSSSAIITLCGLASVTTTGFYYLISSSTTGKLNWNASIILSPITTQSGKIPNPVYNLTTPQLYSFPVPFIGTIPNVILTVDNGSSVSPNIIVAGLASVTLTGFYYVISDTAPPGSNLNWSATQ